MRSRRAARDRPDAPIPDPSVVTGLAPHARRPGRVTVVLNGTPAGTLPIDLVGQHQLAAGLEVSGAALGALVDDMRRTKVLDKGLDLLAVQSRSARDLAVRLRRNALPGDVNWVMERLKAQGFVDDDAYAKQVARGRLLSGGISRRHVESELRRRGVSAEATGRAIDETVAEVGLDEDAAATAAARKRLRVLASLDPATRRRRLYGYLARRGYQPDVIQRVLRVVLGKDRHLEDG